MTKFKVLLFTVTNILRLSGLGAISLGIMGLVFLFEHLDRTQDYQQIFLFILLSFGLSVCLFITAHALSKLQTWAKITASILGVVNILLTILFFKFLPFSIANVYFGIGSLSFLSIFIPNEKIDSKIFKNKNMNTTISIITILLYLSVSLLLFISIGVSSIEE
ncbi:MAG TPA: hypothetical protein VL401_01575 [Alphaproteobacteria bacterium]|jgi:hypothetical protein|nr:hypothetical protein [Alphaproteobacteria bacterium]